MLFARALRKDATRFGQCLAIFDVLRFVAASTTFLTTLNWWQWNSLPWRKDTASERQNYSVNDNCEGYFWMQFISLLCFSIPLKSIHSKALLSLLPLFADALWTVYLSFPTHSIRSGVLHDRKSFRNSWDSKFILTKFSHSKSLLCFPAGPSLLDRTMF